MLRIDDTLLGELGIVGIPQDAADPLLRHIYETLEARVGRELAEQMTDEQLDEFERFFEADDDRGAFQWLEANFPNYKQIVHQQFEGLKEEIRQNAPAIIASVTP